MRSITVPTFFVQDQTGTGSEQLYFERPTESGFRKNKEKKNAKHNVQFPAFFAVEQQAMCGEARKPPGRADHVCMVSETTLSRQETRKFNLFMGTLN